MGYHQPKIADFVIRSAFIVDGSGGPGFIGDVAVTDDRIVGIGDLSETTSGMERNGKNLVLSPGFIDVHTHDDRALLSTPTLDFKVSQGVTTVVTGNCGISLAPLSGQEIPPPLDLIATEPSQLFAKFSHYLEALDLEPPAVNTAALVGHSTLRIDSMQDLQRPASNNETNMMKQKLEKSLDAGAIGFSTGLAYQPASHASTEEVISLAKSLRSVKSVHTTHMRNEGNFIKDSLEETFQIGLEAEVPIVISHHKVGGKANFGRSKETLAMIDSARKRQPLTFDVYPYVASSTILGVKGLDSASKIIVTWSKKRPDLAGRDLSAIAKILDCPPKEAIKALSPAGAIYFMMDEDDVRRIISHPAAMIGSDGLPHDAHPHPRLWGTFPRVLGHYSRNTQLLTLEESVRRMTSLPATEFGLSGRGQIAVGNYADLVLFNSNTIIDQATFEKPTEKADGIELVMVNGRTTWENKKSTGSRPGKVVRRGDS
ncbi:MAG: D-aminoacylase [Rhodospirillaceae bacterium]|nr:D-aminoacylase [Rhodospirillaceae bacterium]